MKSNTHFLSSLSQFFLEWEMFQTKVVEKLSNFFFFVNRAIYEIKCYRQGQATDDNMANAHCISDS